MLLVVDNKDCKLFCLADFWPSCYRQQINNINQRLNVMFLYKTEEFVSLELSITNTSMNFEMFTHLDASFQ